MPPESRTPPQGGHPESCGGTDSPKDTGTPRHNREPLTLLDVLEQVEGESASGSADAADGQRQSMYGEDVRIFAALTDEVRRRAQTGVEFTADDVLPELASRKALGGIFAQLARAGVIRCVGATRSTRRERHGALTRVWIGTGVSHAR